MKKTDSTEIFKNNADAFQRVAEFLNEKNPCSEITAESPLLWFLEKKYKKIDKLLYIYDETAPEIEEKYIKDIGTLFKKCSLVRIIISNNENIVLFQTKSTLGDGEYLVYTKYGKEYSDKYIQVEEWLSETWYVGKS